MNIHERTKNRHPNTGTIHFTIIPQNYEQKPLLYLSPRIRNSVCSYFIIQSDSHIFASYRFELRIALFEFFFFFSFRFKVNCYGDDDHTFRC